MSQFKLNPDREIEQEKLDQQVKRADKQLKVFTLSACASALGLLITYGYSLTCSQTRHGENKEKAVQKDMAGDTSRTNKEIFRLKL